MLTALHTSDLADPFSRLVAFNIVKLSCIWRRRLLGL